jgi:hypothetical protein
VRKRSAVSSDGAAVYREWHVEVKSGVHAKPSEILGVGQVVMPRLLLVVWPRRGQSRESTAAS